MEVRGACRCCLLEGLHKDLKQPYFYFNKKEVYADMLYECFSIVVIPSEVYPNSICEQCIKTLRMSLNFKHQVLNAEQELTNRAKAGYVSGLSIKNEPKQDRGQSDSDDTFLAQKDLKMKVEPKNDSDFSDSDDYFLADTVSVTATEVTVDHIKKEANAEPKKTKSKNKITKKSVKNSDDSWKSRKIRTIVLKSRASDKKETPKSRTITISKENARPKVTFTWSKDTEKIKHRDNLSTILEYSNVLPFKNKSLLGFTCAYCDAAYPDPSDLRSHTDTHEKDRLDIVKQDLTIYCPKLDVTDLTCNLCSNMFDNLNQLKDHLVKIHKKVIHDVKDHIMQFKLKKGEVYDCAMCSSTYETFKMLKQHMNIHYDNYSCAICDAVFATKRSLNAHKNTHQDGNYKCEYCEKVFASRSKKHYHVKMKHLGARNISNCPYCNEPFRSYYQRNQHLIKVHNTESQYKCNICSRSFILKSLLMYHIKKNHLMERNAQCTECGYRFFSKKALKAHMVKHTGERNYSCEVCHKSYARKYTLREHMRIHNNDRRFKCDVCSMTFVQKCSLKSHLLSNHGISLSASEISVS